MDTLTNADYRNTPSFSGLQEKKLLTDALESHLQTNSQILEWQYQNMLIDFFNQLYTLLSKKFASKIDYNQKLKSTFRSELNADNIRLNDLISEEGQSIQRSIFDRIKSKIPSFTTSSSINRSGSRELLYPGFEASTLYDSSVSINNDSILGLLEKYNFIQRTHPSNLTKHINTATQTIKRAAYNWGPWITSTIVFFASTAGTWYLLEKADQFNNEHRNNAPKEELSTGAKMVFSPIIGLIPTVASFSGLYWMKQPKEVKNKVDNDIWRYLDNLEREDERKNNKNGDIERNGCQIYSKEEQVTRKIMKKIVNGLLRTLLNITQHMKNRGYPEDKIFYATPEANRFASRLLACFMAKISQECGADNNTIVEYCKSCLDDGDQSNLLPKILNAYNINVNIKERTFYHHKPSPNTTHSNNLSSSSRQQSSGNNYSGNNYRGTKQSPSFSQSMFSTLTKIEEDIKPVLPNQNKYTHRANNQ